MFLTTTTFCLVQRTGIKTRSLEHFKTIICIFLPRDASALAERCYQIACRLSVRLSVTIRYRVQIGLNSSKIISRPNSVRPMRWLTPNVGDLVQREHPQNWG